MAPQGQRRRRASCPTLCSNLTVSMLIPTPLPSRILNQPTTSLCRRRRRSVTGMAVTASGHPGGRTLVLQWVLDTRKLWPQATRTIHLVEQAKRALDLLPVKDREDVLRYVHVKDAKMALGSRLLKRYLISRYANVPWDQATTTRNHDTKPVFRAADGTEPLIFNVSHQAGLVVLCAALHPPPGAALGVDVVCPAERRDRDHGMIRSESWRSFVDMHSEVLSGCEVASLYRQPFRDLDHRLRYFYTLWCLREAYVKMTGEALLAPWLKRLDMRYFSPPEDAPIGQTEIWFQGRRLENVDLQLVNVLDGYMICTASRRDRHGDSLSLGEYELLDVEEAITFGEKSRAASKEAPFQAMVPLRGQDPKV